MDDQPAATERPQSDPSGHDPAQPDRRRLGQVREPAFLENLSDLSLKELRGRRDLADTVETELSYYRRVLHGRMDLLAFEQSRRRGEETRSLIDALPEILTGRERTGTGTGRHLSMDLPDLPLKGNRHLDRIIGNDLMIRMSEMTEDELSQAASELNELEAEMSGARQQVQVVLDELQRVVIARYKGDPALRTS